MRTYQISVSAGDDRSMEVKNGPIKFRGIDHSNRLEVVLLPLRGSEESITLIG